MFSFLLLGNVMCDWKLAETLTPNPDILGIYGRALHVSSTSPVRLVVSASWEGYEDFPDNYSVDYRTGNAHGAAYIYEYDANKNSYVLIQKFVPSNTSDVIVKNFGSTIQISDDGKRIVGGAPYSYVKNDDGVIVPECGAVVVADWDEQKKMYVQKTVIHVKNPKPKPADNSTDYDEGQGLGRSLTATSDCKIIASAYYNKPTMAQFLKDQGVVFVTYERATGEFDELSRISPSDAYPGKNITDKYFKFGSDLHFTDASHLLIATSLWKQDGAIEKDFGTIHLKKVNEGSWSTDTEIPLPTISGRDWKDYGSPISMPNNNQRIMGTLGTFSDDLSTKTPGAFFISERDNNGWKLVQQIDFPIGKTYSNIEFCDDSMFFTNLEDSTDEQGRTVPVIGVFRKDSSGKYQISERIKGPHFEDSEWIVFGSSQRWGDDCKSIYVGSMAMSKSGGTRTPINGSKTFVYRYTQSNDDSESDTGLIIGITVGVIALIIFIVVVIAIYLRKNKMSNQA